MFLKKHNSTQYLDEQTELPTLLQCNLRAKKEPSTKCQKRAVNLVHRAPAARNHEIGVFGGRVCGRLYERFSYIHTMQIHIIYLFIQQCSSHHVFETKIRFAMKK